MRKMGKSAGVILTLLLCGAGLAAAEDKVLPLPAEDQQKLDSLLGPGVVGQALPCKPIQDASVYFPLHD